MNIKLDRVLAKYTKLELAEMLAHMVDGQDEHDIRGYTGMSTERCKKIADVGHELAMALWS
jgi:hypothetical protein